MSNALAIGAVSFVLVDLLNNGLIDRDIASHTGEVVVSAWSPDQIDAQTQKSKSQLNLFLYNVTPNQGWRNVNYPSRNAAGESINNPPLALNLHYLLTAYGTEQFHAEILLGYGMQLFHETPVLPRDAIRRSLSAPSQVSTGGGLPTAMLNLFTSELAEQVEMIKIWPETLTTEEISRLWTAFQAKYRPTAAYQASVVLIESQTSVKSALPVTARTITPITFQSPVLSQLLSKQDANAPALAGQPILSGSILVLQGTQLKGDLTSVVIGDVEVLPLDTDITASSITLPLPAGLQPGTQSVQVVHAIQLGSPPTPHSGVKSNPLLFLLRPTITSKQLLNLQAAADGTRSGEMQIDLDLAVGPAQQVLLMLNQIVAPASPGVEPLVYTFTAPPRMSLASPPLSPPPPTTQITVPFTGVFPGTYLVRVQVDGAQSVLSQDAGGNFISPQVTIA